MPIPLLAPKDLSPDPPTGGQQRANHADLRSQGDDKWLFVMFH